MSFYSNSKATKNEEKMYAEDKFIEPKTLGLRDATSAKKVIEDKIVCG